MDIEQETKLDNKDPFLQRAIEHWLDSVNELGYQPLFCQWLTTKGHVLKYSIKNTNFEKGKDVVSVDPTGVPCAYQLKGGKITLDRWRKEVKPEIDIMIGSPIEHPDISKDTKHISYLVTNGELDDSVRVEIVGLNEGVWKETPLKVWERGDLLTGFQSIAEGVLPKDALAYKNLMELIFADGFGPSNIAEVESFLKQILNLEDPTIKKAQRKRDIAAGLLYATMIAGVYRQVKNHFSIVRILTILISLIFYLVDKYKLEDKYWLDSYEIVWGDLLNTAKSLEEEIETEGFDVSFTDPLTTDLIPFRKHAAASLVHALTLSKLIAQDSSWSRIIKQEISEKYKSSLLIWGEASFIPSLFITFIFRNVEGTEERALLHVTNAVSEIVKFNGRNSKNVPGLLPPYYESDFLMDLAHNVLEEPFDYNFKLSSYLLGPLIDVLVRANQRDFIASNWKELSFMHLEEFLPETPEDYYLWRSEKGENRTSLLNREQKWSELVIKAKNYEVNRLPITLKRFSAFIPFFLNTYPHRLTVDLAGYLDEVSKTTPLQLAS